MTTGLDNPSVILEGVKKQGQLAGVPYTIIVRDAKSISTVSVNGVYDNGGTDTKATTCPSYASISTDGIDHIYVPAIQSLTEEASPYNAVVLATVNGVVWSIVIPIEAYDESTLVEA